MSEVTLPLTGVRLHGSLMIPDGARGAVLFGKKCPRNVYVAEELRRVGFATLLMDLLTEDEEESERFTGHLRFDIDLLAARLAAAAQWFSSQRGTADFGLGYFGVGTGAAAALVAAARAPHHVDAVVSRSGRPDLAGTELRRVNCPTLLIAGSDDEVVLEANQEALTQLHAPAKLAVVPGATHLFDEPGALDEAAGLAVGWFTQWLIEARRERGQQPAPY